MSMLHHVPGGPGSLVDLDIQTLHTIGSHSAASVHVCYETEHGLTRRYPVVPGLASIASQLVLSSSQLG